MADEQPVDDRWPVPDVIDSLLRAALPAELHALVPRLVILVADRPHVTEHLQKLWGELSEGEGNLVAREVELVAREAITGAPTAPGKLLH